MLRKAALPAFEAIEAKILAAEHQFQLAMTWSRSREKAAELLRTLEWVHWNAALEVSQNTKVTDALLSLIRRDISSVLLLVDQTTLGKSYALNRFLIHLLTYVLGPVNLKNPSSSPLSGYPPALPTFGVLYGCATSIYEMAKNQVVVTYWDKSTETCTCDHFVERIGLSEAPALQLLGLKKADTRNRVHFSKIPLPFTSSS
jgi:hypothetical protein